MTSTIETQTPVEIDTEWAALNAERAQLEARNVGLARVSQRLQERYEAYGSDLDLEAANDANAQSAINYARIHDIDDRLATLRAEFSRRGGWNRFYLVTNTNGHVHWTMNCNTCFDDTDFAWLTQFSGMAHDDLVELAGESACTICFPDAPVDVLKRPSKLTTPEREAREAEKAAKAAEKAVNEVVVEGLIDFGRLQRAKTFKSARAVTNLIASELSSMCWYGPTHPSFKDWEGNVVVLRKALEAKGIDYDYDKTLANARKRVVKDGGEAKF